MVTLVAVPTSVNRSIAAASAFVAVMAVTQPAMTSTAPNRISLETLIRITSVPPFGAIRLSSFGTDSEPH